LALSSSACIDRFTNKDINKVTTTGETVMDHKSHTVITSDWASPDDMHQWLL
jgi:hypothetical protein